MFPDMYSNDKTSSKKNKCTEKLKWRVISSRFHYLREASFEREWRRMSTPIARARCISSSANVKFQSASRVRAGRISGTNAAGSLNFKIPIKYRTETIRAGICAAAVGKKSDTSCRTGSHLGKRSPWSAQMRHTYVLYVTYNARCAEPRLRSCERRDSRRRNRRTVADTFDVMRPKTSRTNKSAGVHASSRYREPGE